MRDDVQEINNRIDTLSRLVSELRLEIRELRQERTQEIQTQEGARAEERAQAEERARAQARAQDQQRDEEFRRGDRVVIINHYRNQYGRRVTVTRVHGERVYFTLDGRPSYRLKQNVELESDFLARTA